MKRIHVLLFLFLTTTACTSAPQSLRTEVATPTTVAAPAKAASASQYSLTGPTLPIAIEPLGTDWHVTQVEYTDTGEAMVMSLTLKGEIEASDLSVMLIEMTVLRKSGANDPAVYAANMAKSVEDPRFSLSLDESSNTHGGHTFRYHGFNENEGMRGMFYVRKLNGDGTPMMLSTHLTWKSQGDIADTAFVAAPHVRNDCSHIPGLVPSVQTAT